MEKIILKLTADIFKDAVFKAPHLCPIAVATRRDLNLPANLIPVEGIYDLSILDVNHKENMKDYNHVSYNQEDYDLDYTQAKMCAFSPKEVIREIELTPIN